MNGMGISSKRWVIKLIIINAVIFVIEILFASPDPDGNSMIIGGILNKYFGLVPYLVINNYFLWQFVTYMFLHGGYLHLLFNMYALFLFGLPVEQAWGSRRFLIYYMFTGIGAGLTIFVINTFLGGKDFYTTTVGASGAVFGLLLAFGLLFPDIELFFLFIPIPIRAKYLVFIYGGIEVLLLIWTGGRSNISHTGHLGGLLFGLIYFIIIKKRGISFKSKMIKARLNRQINRRQAKSVPVSRTGESMLWDILHKIKNAGPDSLSDDEYQYIKYMEIMMQDMDSLCVEEDFDSDDDYCKKCGSIDACLLRQIKKYL